MKAPSSVRSIEISSIRVPPGRARSERDHTLLAESIREIGLMQPIVVTKDLVLVAGLHRLRACEDLGWKKIPATVRDLEGLAAELAEIDENLVRADLTFLERSDHLARRKKIYEALHPETKSGPAQALGANRKQGKGHVSEIVSPTFAKDTAAKTGVSKRTVEHEVRIAEKIDPDVKAAIRDTEIADSKTDLIALSRLPVEKQKAVADRVTSGNAATVREAVAAERRQERVANLARIATGAAPLDGTVGTFPVIYADPPWRYEHVLTESRAIENQYPTMELGAICELPVAERCTEDAILFLWATSPKLAEALQVIEAWGFTYRSSMVWVKDRIGMGYYARQRHELLLVATRGSPPTPAPGDRPDSVIELPIGEHSAKPERFAELIERMYPTLPKLELFCRSPREGWKAWGYEAA